MAAGDMGVTGTAVGRPERLDALLRELLGTLPGLEAACLVSFDGLPMADALPVGMDADRVAAMSAALLSLGERAAEGLGRGGLSQVYIEGENGTVFLVSADGEAVLVAVTSYGVKAGLALYELRRAALELGRVLREPPAASGHPPAFAPPTAAEAGGGPAWTTTAVPVTNGAAGPTPSWS